jgi:hypothetical protein
MNCWYGLRVGTTNVMATIEITNKMQYIDLFIFSKSAQHVSGDVFAHHQKYLPYKKIKFLYMFRVQSFLSGCTRHSLAESDDTRGCICTICVVDLLMMGGLRSKHVEEFNFM